MRLNAIRLSGFKSFVDNTQFDTKQQCVAVVGPNGCGKSNIMDAVRWVLGESRAGELRGESMQDVIFNGSNTRKPSFKASVELIFDNTSARLQGEWGRYTEVSVKRSLSRDGDSNYYINNQLVRRKDIQDMFSGTGLGPKAYAIIGQGMIAKIIEAKPEELRIFLEEAAGVSKYKDRRKDTQARLENAEENLLRIQDLISEINTQLSKLEQQASNAKKYLEYYKQMLYYEYAYLKISIDNETRKSQETNVNYENTKTSIQDLSNQIYSNESQQQNLSGKNAVYLQQLNEAQHNYNNINQELAKLEERKQFQTEQLTNIQKLINETQNIIIEEQSKSEYYKEQKEMLEQQIEDAIIEMESALEQQNSKTYDELSQQQQKINSNLHQKKQYYTNYQQELKLSQQKQQLLLQNIAQKHQKYQKIQQELQNLRNISQQDVDILNLDIENQQQNLQQLKQKLAHIQNEIIHQQSSHSANSQKVQSESIEMNRLQANLQAMHNLANIENNSNLEQYLSSLNLSKLTDLIKVQPEWEIAIASILHHKICAYCSVNSMDSTQFKHQILDYINNLEKTEKACIVTIQDNYPQGELPLDSIFNYVQIKNIQISAVLYEWLHKYHICHDINHAINNCSNLNTGHAYILNDGTIIDKFSITMYSSSNANDLANKRKIENLQQQIKAQEIILEQAKQNFSSSVSYTGHLQQTFNQLQQQIQNQNTSLSEQKLAIDKIQQQQEFAKTRLSSYEEDIVELQTQMSSEREEHAELDFIIEEYQEKISSIEDEIESINEKLDLINKQINQEKDIYNKQQLRMQSLNFTEQNLKQNLTRLQQDIQQTEKNSLKAKDKLLELEQQLQDLEHKNIQAKIEQSLIDKQSDEIALKEAQNLVGQYHENIQNIQQQLKNLNADLLPLYEKLHQFELNIQASSININQFEQELSIKVEQLNKHKQELPVDDIIRPMTISSLKQNININKQNIESLGNVNLAAINELEEVSARHNLLINQIQDIQTAIYTLKDAIEKIDQETREMLLNTFNSVNLEFSRLFPELFGGGKAQLSLTESDMLYSGVQVMAQPPGKKNATIHLLSGGEKALTAIALVFAIFALNPAPFCLLDEVDAPLDDANTERYAKMIKKMSSNTQFLFISHNKIAMEIAEQLIGVTMQEQGVSRIVAVDMIDLNKL